MDNITLSKAKQIASRIHSKYKEDSKPPTGNQNCQLCTWCAEAQFRGIDVLPRPVYSPRDPVLEIPGEKIIKNPKKISIKNTDDVIRTVTSSGNGSRYYVHVKWKDGNGGHEFLLLNINNDVYVMDSQQGLIQVIDKTDYFDFTDFSKSFIVRLDDKIFNRELFDKNNDRSQILEWDESKDIPYMRDHDMLGNDEEIPVTEDGIYIRPAEMSEFDQIIEWTKETINEALWSKKTIMDQIEKDTRENFKHIKMIVDGKANDKTIGMYEAYAIDDGEWWYLDEIYLIPEYRGKGIGSTLIKRDMASHDKLVLRVDSENKKAIKLYESLGFEITERHENSYVMRLDQTKTTQEAFIDDRTRPLVPVTDIDFDTVYYGDAINAGKTRVLDGKPLFVSPLKGIASIFSDRRGRIREEMRKRGYYNYDMGYIEWSLPLDQLQKPLKEVHVYIKRYPDLEPFEFEGEGYIHTIDISKIKDKICRFDWMEPDREILIAGIDSVDIKKVEKAKVKYYVAGVNHYDKSLFQEGAVMFVQEFDPLKLYSAINKTKTEYRDKMINIGDFDRVPLNRATAEEYDEGHGQWVTPLSRYNVDDDHFEGTILVDEHGICPGYLVIDNRPDGSKWILGVESSMDYKSFAIVAQLLYLARTEFDTKNAIAPKTNKALIECYLDNGWTISDQNPHVVVLKYENDDKDDETDYEPDGVADVVTEYMIMELSKTTLMFHVSDKKNLDGQVFRPRVPDYLDPYDPKDTGFENNTTPRVCFAPTIDGALNAITFNVQPSDPVKFDKMYVYIPEKPFNQYKHKTNKEIIRDKDVYDANVTGEAWILEPVRLRLYGVIQVDQNRKVKRKKTVPTSENVRGDRNVFSYRWHWLVKPKVISSTVGKVKYDAMAVCDMIARELYQFKYGLCVDGRKKSNATDADYDKYWRLQSPEQFEQSRVGNCYDFTEWEAGFLDAYYVKYKKYFINAVNDKNVTTHTFVVVPDNGKYIYLEGAFKRVADEIHHMKVFDKLEDIFEYIVECMVEIDNVPEYDYGVWDYTDNGIKPGTDIKHFQEDIFNGDPIHEGNVKRKKE